MNIEKFDGYHQPLQKGCAQVIVPPIVCENDRNIFNLATVFTKKEYNISK